MPEQDENKKISIAIRKILGEVQEKNSATLNTEQVKIKKVLSVSACPVVENVDVSASQVKYDGFVLYNAFVALEDDSLLKTTQTSAFSGIYENAQIVLDSIISVEPSIFELSTQKVGNDFTASALLKFNLSQTTQNNDVKCAMPDDNLFVKESEQEISSLINKNFYTSTVSYDIQKDSKTKKVLYATNFGTIKSITPSSNFYVVAGDISATVVVEGEDGTIRTIQREISFSEEIEAQTVTPESIVQATINCSKDFVVIDSEENNSYVIEVPISIVSSSYSKTKINCVVDAYSVDKEIKITTQSFEQSEFFTTRSAEENLIANFTLGESAPKIEKVLSFVPENVSLVNTLIKNGELTLEGIANFSLIYYSEDEEGNKVLNSVVVDVPYSVVQMVPELLEGDNVFAAVTIGQANVKNKRGAELDILATLKINYNIFRTVTFALATEIVYGEEKLAKDCALEIYVAKENQSLWDIAKELNISMQDLLTQNAELTLPLNVGEKIVAYRQREAKF